MTEPEGTPPPLPPSSTPPQQSTLPPPPPGTYWAPYPASSSDISSKKLAAGICGILLGAFGVHKFIIGKTTEGVTMLLVSLVAPMAAIPLMLIPIIGFIPMILAPFAYGAMAIIGLIEGIMYLTRSDEEFARLNLYGPKGWF